MANATHKMGGDNVLTNTLGILFTDGTLQTTAAVAPPTPPAPVLLQATITLVAAQLLALSTNPITLIAAPGAGFYLWPQYYTMEYTFGGVAYSSPSHNDDCYLTYGLPPAVTSNEIVVYGWANVASGIIEAAASCTFIGICGEGLTPITTVNNAAVVFSAPHALTLGNGQLKITVNYSVCTI
jgi:hypothetical protein